MRFFPLPGGNETGILFNDEKLTREQIRHQAYCLADTLLNRWSVPLQRVAMLVDPCPRQQICVLALHHAGITCVPLAKSLPAERIRVIVNQLNIDLVIGDSLPQTEPGIRLDQLFTLACQHNNELTEPADAPASADCLILHTSGSTGEPKAIALSRDNILSMIEAFIATPLSGASSMANRICSFDFSVIETLPYLYQGRVVHIIDQPTRDSPLRLAQAILSSPAEVIAMTPSWFYEVARHMVQLQHNYPLAQPKKIIFGGEKIKYPALSAWWKVFVERHGYQVFNIYGPTECSVFVTYHAVSAADRCDHAARIGAVFGENDVFLCNERGERICHEHQQGRIMVRGRSVASGYLTAEGLQPFSAEPGAKRYDTGDLGYRIGTDFYIVGRVDNQVKVRGFRIDTDEIVRHITAVAGEGDCHVTVFSNERTEHIVAFVTARQDHIVEEIYRYLATRLPEYALPNHICRLDHLPTNANGKVDERALRHTYLQTLDEKNLRLLAQRIQTRAWPAHYTLMDLHLTSLETVELIIELEMAYGATIQNMDKKQNLHQLAALCENLPKTRQALSDQPRLHASRTLPTQGYYCDNYFNYHIRRDAVSVTLLFPATYSAATIRQGIWRLLNQVPSLHCRLAQQQGEIWQFDTDLPDDLTHFELPASDQPHLTQDFDFAAGKLFYYQLCQDSRGHFLTLHIAHVMADGFACKLLIGWLLQLIEQNGIVQVKPLHQYASQVWQTMPPDLEPLRQFWAKQGSITHPAQLFGHIPVAIPAGEVSGSISRLMCNFLPMAVINRTIVARGISLHTFVCYAVWRLQQLTHPDTRLEFHSPVGNRDSENSTVIANLIKIVPFSIEPDAELTTGAQLLQMQQAIDLTIASCQLSWPEIARLTQRPRIGLIVAESPRPFRDAQRGITEHASPARVIAKNALSFFYCSLEKGLRVDLRYNLSVAGEAGIDRLKEVFSQVMLTIISELSATDEQA